ncbi:MAG: hypothetical protein Q9162_003728 [Coniocarpon cinnabarinum]
MSTYLIIGAGVFGSSTALHLKKSKPNIDVTLIDSSFDPNPTAASSDVSKIIRSDYDDIFYMNLALEAQQAWRHDPIYSPYYHESGILLAEDKGIGRNSYNNHKALGVDSSCEILTPNDARRRFGKWFANADWTDVKENFFNPCSGWAEADATLRSILQAARGAGVRFARAKIAKLMFGTAGECTGVELEGSGERLTAARVVCCTGSRMAKLFADSAPENRALQVNGRMVATGAVSCTVQCETEHRHRYEGAPVLFMGLHHTRGESIPMNKEGLLKFNYEVSFTNTFMHEASSQEISIPPTKDSQTTWGQDVPQGLKDEVLTVVKNIYGPDAPGLEIGSFRMCWDALTPNQDFIISQHPHGENLYVATGGSFHGWKFLPTVGKYVVQMLDGTLDNEKARRWAWDRPDQGAACMEYNPQRDLKDIRGYNQLQGESRSTPNLRREKESTFTHPDTGETFVFRFVMTKNSENNKHTYTDDTDDGYDSEDVERIRTY